MATLRCPCGKLLNNHADNNETQGYLLTEQDVLEHEYSRNEDATEWALEAGRGVWECKSCGRLAFNWPFRSMSDVKWYAPEDGQPGRLMAQTRYEINNA